MLSKKIITFFKVKTLINLMASVCKNAAIGLKKGTCFCFEIMCLNASAVCAQINHQFAKQKLVYREPYGGIFSKKLVKIDFIWAS